MENKKIKWTAIDTLIVIVVAAVVAVAALVFAPKLSGGAKNEKVSFVVMLQEKEPELLDAMKAGDRVTISLTEKDGGVITDVKGEVAKTLAYNSIDGTYSNQLVDGKVDIYVTVEADCTVSETAAKAGDTAIKVGTEVPVRGKGFASMGFIIAINE